MPIKGTRFLLAYTVASDRLIVLAVYHSAKKWPNAWLRAHVTASIRQADAGKFASDEEVQRFYDSLKDGESPERPEKS